MTGRPRVGHGWTAIRVSSRLLWLFQDSVGRWRTTGEASAWARCERCRRPFDEAAPDSRLCSYCYFYGSDLPVEEFWGLHEAGHPAAPYNIGKRCQASAAWAVLAAINKEPRKWRSILRSQWETAAEPAEATLTSRLKGPKR